MRSMLESPRTRTGFRPLKVQSCSFRLGLLRCPTLWASRAESQKEHSTLRAPCGSWEGDKKVWASGSAYPPGLLIAESGVVGCAMARLGRSESLTCVALLRLLILAGVAWVGGVISGLFGGGSRLSSDEKHMLESDMWATTGFDGAAVSVDPVANVESVCAAG
ncbi:hypothetical protein D5F01_LYC20137 [Larimichthys crocea]|uniref:Uncharacterized protein n=1 Tax=Larimichthys crocea TaxID=215358 RepID=A0A6G0HQ15_LARCR|nr:hypothetical protein D5F01_LYC20137 [Larimichthys crocea]